MNFGLELLIFVLCLSVLIVVHELGHLTAAKAFGVYCFEFSVGFGPALFRRKRKNGETYVALRAIPFGGFVSMYGENNGETKEKNELPDGIESIPPHRSLANIKKWKKAIILGAGVTLNALLALCLFFVSNGPWFAQQTLYLYQFDVKENSVAANVGFNVGQDFDNVLTFYQSENEEEKAKLVKNSLQVLSFDSEIVYKDDTTQPVAALFSQDANAWSFKNRTLDNHVFYFTYTDNNLINFEDQVIADRENLKQINLKISMSPYATKIENEKEVHYVDYENKVVHTLELPISFNGTDKVITETGISSILYSYRYNFGQAIGQTFKDFGSASTMIVEALGNLVIGRGWDSVGGPVAIFTQSSKMLTEFGITQFLDLWAIISVNLAIFNLIPFPGLDGWQLLVLAVEGISKKKMPDKVQQIVSLIGMGLLFVLMAVILFKDIFTLF